MRPRRGGVMDDLQATGIGETRSLWHTFCNDGISQNGVSKRKPMLVQPTE